MKLLPPATYQGGKSRIASRILATMNVPRDHDFFDLCCGSGAISLAMVENGHDPSRIVMVDSGPWGVFWRAVGRGEFDMATLESRVAEMPRDSSLIRRHLLTIRDAPMRDEWVYDFVLLQAGAFGGKAVTYQKGRWSKTPMRDLWTPRPGAKSTMTVQPMMPMPSTIVERMAAIVTAMRGVTGYHSDVRKIRPATEHATVYLDPPYANTSGYHLAGFNVSVLASVLGIHWNTWVSEGAALTKQAHRIAASTDDRRGGSTSLRGSMSGNRVKAPHDEWLSFYPKIGGQ